MKLSYQLQWDFHQEQEWLQEDAWNSSSGQLFETNRGKKKLDQDVITYMIRKLA